MKDRVLTGIAIFAVLALMFVSRLLSLYIFDVCLGIIIIISALEFSKILGRMGKYNYMTLVGIYPSIMYITMTASIKANLTLWLVILIQIAIILVILFFTAVISLFFKTKLNKNMKELNVNVSLSKFAFNKALNTVFALLYPSLMFGLLILVNHFDIFTKDFATISQFNSQFAWLPLICAFIIPIITDTFAMLFGSLIKGPKLSPKISPKKTVSGFSFAVVWTTFVMAIVFFAFNAIEPFATAFSALNINLFQFMILGFAGSLVCQCGDLFESFVKRKARMKDSGDFLPGHGGFLDRFDSHIFNAVFIFIFFIILL